LSPGSTSAITSPSSGPKTEPARHGFGRAPVVPGDHHRFDAAGTQRSQRRLRPGLGLVAKRHQCTKREARRGALGHGRHRRALLLQFGGPRGQRPSATPSSSIQRRLPIK
jgi:hypothetical protein